MINDEMDLDKVQKIMDDTKDGIAYQNEIQDMITREFTEEDEEDVMRELDALLDIEVFVCLCYRLRKK
jgi:charged multivesicular body protein 6